MSLNKVSLIGRVGKDPEIRHLDSGVSVANFSIAVSDKYKNKQGEQVENTEWVNIVIWNKFLVEIVEKYINKGDLIYIEGKLQTRSYDDKDGNKRYITEVVLNQFKGEIQMLGSKSEKQAVEGNQTIYPDKEEKTAKEVYYEKTYKNDAPERDSIPPPPELPY